MLHPARRMKVDHTLFDQPPRAGMACGMITPLERRKATAPDHLNAIRKLPLRQRVGHCDVSTVTSCPNAARA